VSIVENSSGSYSPPPGARPPDTSSGCGKAAFGGCVVAGIAIAVLAAVAVFGVYWFRRSIDVYAEALARAKNDPRVQAALGEPVRTERMRNGNINLRTGRGVAHLEIALSGTRDRGMLRVEATRNGEKWDYSVLTVTPEHGPPIDLLKP
jgi:hypothetical protein